MRNNKSVTMQLNRGLHGRDRVIFDSFFKLVSGTTWRHGLTYYKRAEETLL